jgi:transcriptional regulator with XRE-family HTH domain
MTAKSFGVAVKTRRESLNLSRARLAAELGVLDHFVRMIECGEYDVTLNQAIAIAQVLDVTLGYLVGET